MFSKFLQVAVACLTSRVFAAAAGQGSDFTISLQHPGFDHVELPVHKLVLAMRSPVLRGMLHSDMAEARLGRIVIRDVIPPAAKAMVHFLYTDRLPAGEQGLPQCAAVRHMSYNEAQNNVGPASVPSLLMKCGVLHVFLCCW
jgi:hypothetical protein